MIRRIVVLVLSISFFLVACTSKQDVLPQPIALPKTTRTGIPLSQASRDFTGVHWWVRLHDPVLNQLIAQALIHNNQLQVAQATIEQAQAQLKAAHNAWLPTLDVALNGFAAKGWDASRHVNAAVAANPLITDLGNINAHGNFYGFVPEYSFNILKNMSNTSVARASLGVQQGMYAAMRLSIISQVSGSYFTLLGQKQQFNEQQQLIIHLKQLRRIEYIRYKDGAGDVLILASLDQQIASNQAAIRSLSASIEHTENALQLLINKNPGPIATHHSLNDWTLLHVIPANLPASVLSARPDLIIATENLKSAVAQKGLAYSNFFPDISLTGSLGGLSLDLARLIQLSSGIGFAQYAASIPAFNASAYQQIQAAKAGVKSAAYNYLHVLRTALVDVNNSLVLYQQKTLAYKHQGDSLRAAAKAYAINQVKHKTGAQDVRAVLNAQITLDEAKINDTLARIEQMNALVSVYQSLGCGVR